MDCDGSPGRLQRPGIGGGIAPGFRIELHRKASDPALPTGRALGVGMPGTATAPGLSNACVAHGGKAWDHSAMVRVLETPANIRIGQNA